MAESEDKQTKGFSLKFTKKKETKVLKNTGIGEKEERKEETDYVTSLDEPKSKQKEENELVIPLIQQNKWRSSRLPHQLEEESDKKEEQKENGNPGELISATADSTESQAVLELLKEARQAQEGTQNSDGYSTNMAIPLLMQNKVPEGFETDDHLDVSLRPDEPETANYDEVPIDAFGKALLRGMGWKEGQGIGKNNEKAVPVVAVARPKGLGLGADRSKALQTAQQQSKQGGDEEEKLTLSPDTHCLVTNGRHKDLYGTIVRTDEENARVIIKLTLSGQTVTVTQYAIKLVTPKEHKKYSKILNKAKVDKYKEEESRKDREQENGHDSDRGSRNSSKYEREDKSKKDRKDRDKRDRHTDDNRDRQGDSSRDRHRDHSSHRSRDDSSDRQSDERRSNGDRERDRSHHNSSHPERKRKSEHRNSPDSQTSERTEKKHRSSHQTRSWLRPHLRVRIVDKHFKKGKYYKEKVVIEDVTDPETCICRTTDNKVLEDVSMSMLETVVPRSDNSHVMVVTGKQVGQLGEILQRDKSKCLANVQLLQDRSSVLTLDFDGICEYVGDIYLEFDY